MGTEPMKREEVHTLVPDGALVGTEHMSGIPVFSDADGTLFGEVLDARVSRHRPGNEAQAEKMRDALVHGGASAAWDMWEVQEEARREGAGGAGWPGCGCATQCEGCWPLAAVRNGVAEEYVLLAFPPERHARALEAGRDGPHVRAPAGETGQVAPEEVPEELASGLVALRGRLREEAEMLDLGEWDAQSRAATGALEAKAPELALAVLVLQSDPQVEVRSHLDGLDEAQRRSHVAEHEKAIDRFVHAHARKGTAASAMLKAPTPEALARCRGALDTHSLGQYTDPDAGAKHVADFVDTARRVLVARERLHEACKDPAQRTAMMQEATVHWGRVKPWEAQATRTRRGVERD